MKAFLAVLTFIALATPGMAGPIFNRGACAGGACSPTVQVAVNVGTPYESTLCGSVIRAGDGAFFLTTYDSQFKLILNDTPIPSTGVVCVQGVVDYSAKPYPTIFVRTMSGRSTAAANVQAAQTGCAGVQAAGCAGAESQGRTRRFHIFPLRHHRKAAGCQ